MAGPVRVIPAPPASSLSVPDEIRWGAWRIAASARASQAVDEAGLWEAVLDADRVGSPLTVRGRRPGDRFQPLGMRQLAKLQDVLVNARVPRTERDAWPLIEGPGGIVWVPGIRIAEPAKVTDATRRVLLLTAERAG